MRPRVRPVTWRNPEGSPQNTGCRRLVRLAEGRQTLKLDVIYNIVEKVLHFCDKVGGSAVPPIKEDPSDVLRIC